MIVDAWSSLSIGKAAPTKKWTSSIQEWKADIVVFLRVLSPQPCPLVISTTRTQRELATLLGNRFISAVISKTTKRSRTEPYIIGDVRAEIPVPAF